jgi:hypothetical protein
MTARVKHVIPIFSSHLIIATIKAQASACEKIIGAASGK